jgi:hypothetical protein
MSNDRHGFVVHHLKDRHQRRCATLVAFEDGSGGLAVGWSKCALRKEGRRCDDFCKHKGFAIAVSRAASGRPLESETRRLPFIVKDNIGPFCERARRYFRKRETAALPPSPASSSGS